MVTFISMWQLCTFEKHHLRPQQLRFLQKCWNRLKSSLVLEIKFCAAKFNILLNMLKKSSLECMKNCTKTLLLDYFAVHFAKIETNVLTNTVCVFCVLRQIITSFSISISYMIIYSCVNVGCLERHTINEDNIDRIAEISSLQ